MAKVNVNEIEMVVCQTPVGLATDEDYMESIVVDTIDGLADVERISYNYKTHKVVMTIDYKNKNVSSILTDLSKVQRTLVNGKEIENFIELFKQDAERVCREVYIMSRD